MTVQTTGNLTNSIQALYTKKYKTGARMSRLYDQLAVDYTKFQPGSTMDELMASSAINVPFLSDMVPGTAAVSQTVDVTPQTLTDALSSITTTSRGEALQWTKQLELQVYTDYTAQAHEMVGKAAQETVELVAQNAALQGSWVYRGAARASLDAGTAAHRASDAIFRALTSDMLTLRVPGFVSPDGGTQVWSAIMSPQPFHDICESGNVDLIGQYQDAGIHLRFELAQIGPFRLLVSPFAKTFWGAGAANGTAVSTTLASAAPALNTTLVTAADVSANVAAGRWWSVGTTETANTHYATNEPVKPLSASTVTITFNGMAPNGGLRFRHEAGIAVKNADPVYTIVFGGPESLVRVYATDVGPEGQIVGPKKTGILDQFNTLGFLWYGGYGRVSENRIVRYEVSSSFDA